MLSNFNSRAASAATSPVATPDDQLAWHAWLDQVASRIAASAPDDRKIQFVADLIRDAATTAALHALPDPVTHYMWMLETGDDPHPTDQDGPAAPIPPGTLAGHESQPGLYHAATDAAEDLPW